MISSYKKTTYRVCYIYIIEELMIKKREVLTWDWYKLQTYVHKDSIYIVSVTVTLEAGEVRSKVVS